MNLLHLSLTCQLVAVRGTREKSHPCCEGRSAVRRIYLAQTPVNKAPIEAHGVLKLTYQRGPPYPLRSRTSGFGNPNLGMAVASVNEGMTGNKMCAISIREARIHYCNRRGKSYRGETVGSKLRDNHSQYLGIACLPTNKPTGMLLILGSPS